MKIREEISKTETKKMQNISKMKSWFLNNKQNLYTNDQSNQKEIGPKLVK